MFRFKRELGIRCFDTRVLKWSLLTVLTINLEREKGKEEKYKNLWS